MCCRSGNTVAGGRVWNSEFSISDSGYKGSSPVSQATYITGFEKDTVHKILRWKKYRLMSSFEIITPRFELGTPVVYLVAFTTSMVCRL